MKKPLVLVVDDTDPSRYITVRVLRDAQMEVIEGATGEEALRLVEERKPDLVVLDIKLPDINGLEVCRRIRANSSLQRIAVLHMSATYVTPEIEQESQASGGDIYLAQPVQPRELVSVVRALLRMRELDGERESVMRLGQAALEEAGKVARLKDEFLATLSHELRTPISVLTNWLNVMRASQPDPEEFANGLEVMQRNARLMTKLINDLLDVSGIMSGKLVLDREPASVETLLTSTIDNVRPAAEAKEITIAAECSALAGPAMIDPNRLQQVFLNLLSNAIKFTPGGGRIDVRCRQVGSQIEIAVSDNGEGIAPAMLAAIFDRFRQVDSSMTRRYGGLGLGLAIVRHIVELHGGSVSAHSEGLGKGATFTLRLPFVPASIQRGPSGRPLSGPAESGNRLRNLRILAVDDDADARDALARLLLRERAVVKIAGDAQEALRAVETWRPDVYLLDLGMPGESGYDLLAQLKRRLGDSVPAIALTGYAREEDAARALYAGFRAHVAKPYELDELCRQIINVAHPARP
jgi:signal transduction histidine kinase